MVNDKRTGATFSVNHTDHLWIEMPDGTRLAARLWQPETPHPVPAILEYIPYRKSDMVRARDERNHPYLAAHGYAAIRVDMRGSGDSEGHMPDMYDPKELADAREVINWLTAQPWCNGNVGMFGTSWGGTASLQASVNAPEALKAVIAVCATHDRFEDDIHYMGGCVLTDTFEWGATLPAILGSPPTPNAGDDWIALWQERLKALPCPVENWLRADARGTFWRHGSVIHKAEDLSVPILSVGGWSDRYSNSVMALANARPDLVWGVVGPWGHHYPDRGAPGPAIGFQQMALDWWDHWLGTKEPQQPKWPHLRVWLREFEKPQDTLTQRKGRWIESGPPQKETDTTDLTFGEHLLGPEKDGWLVPSDPGVGMTSGDTGYFGRAGGLPLDQQEDDDLSLVFETAPFDEDIVIYGASTLTLKGHTDTGDGHIAARLNDVSATGEVLRITHGVRNLALDKHLDRPAGSGRPGAFTVDMALHSTAYLVRKGHRLRLAISQAMWPLVLSEASAGEIALHAGTLILPHLAATPSPLTVPFLPALDLPVEKSHRTLENPPLQRWRSQDATAKVVGWHQPYTAEHYDETGTTFAFETRMEHRLETAEVPVQVTQISHEMHFERPDGRAVVSTTLESRKCTAEWTVKVGFSASWRDNEVAALEWLIEPNL